MKRWQGVACVGVLAIGGVVPPAAGATAIEREFVYAPDRFSLVEREGVTELGMSGATREFAPGRPDLPWVGEQVEIPAGLRVTRVEVVALETEVLAERAVLPSAVEPRPGLGPIARTAPDPEHFARPGFQPPVAARLGYQGWQRDRNLALLEVCPARWDPVSGRLERVERVRVRLSLEPGLEPAVPRLRVVPEWEDGRPGAAARAAAAPEAAGAGDRRRPEPFRARQIPSLLGSPVAYVIITDEAMTGEFQRLADWKTQSGVPAVVRTLSFIRQEYRLGSDDAERIRHFIRDAYSRWGTRWVLLGGDTEILPTRYAYTTFYGGENIACDMYYSCLDGNWNADGDALYGEGRIDPNPADEVDLLPEVWVGRAPATTPAQAALFVDKTLQYAKQPVGDYEHRLLFFAEVLFPQHWRPGDYISLDGAQLAEDVLPTLRANPAIRYARLYENHTDPRWEPGALPENRVAVLDSLSRGYNISIHIGHGYRNVMSVGDANIDNADMLRLTNGNRLTHLYANNCTSNAIDFPSIGEAIMLAPDGGAVTNIGSSRFDFPVAGRFFTEEYFRLLYRDSVTAVGEAQARQKIPFAPGSVYDGLNRWTTLTLLLLGDPELRVYTGRPRVLTVTHPASIALSDTGIAVRVTVGGVPLMGARVVAYKPDDEYRTAVTDGAGNAFVPFRASSVGSFFLTVTGFDCRPYQAVIALTPAAPPVLAALTPAVDDTEALETAGDGNGVPDAGETVNLRVPVRNNGGSSASSVVGTLTTTDPMVEVLIGSVAYGTLAAGATSSPPGGFRLRFAADMPDQREVPLRLTLVDGTARTTVRNLQLTVCAPDLRHLSHVVTDLGGNGDGRPDPGETVRYRIRLANLGCATGLGVSGTLRNHDGLATVTDSAASWATLAPGQEGESDEVEFVVHDANARLELLIADRYGPLFARILDLRWPAAPSGVLGSGRARSITLTWSPNPDADLSGYHVYRGDAPGGPFAKITALPTDRVSYFLDDGLQPLRRYYYQVAAVDSSANESARSAVEGTTTTLPFHPIFPIPMGRGTPSSVAIDHLYAAHPMSIVVGADVLYVWNPDGSAPVDADGSGATSGDFTRLGQYYAAGPSIADLDGDGVPEIIAPTWESKNVYVFDLAGRPKPGWPAALAHEVWSSAAIGDLDNDGTQELVFGSNGNRLYAFRANGTEWRDGDNNPATLGVFKVLGSFFNYGTPALADLDGNGIRDIVYGAFDGRLYAWRPDGGNLPGFPITLSQSVTASVAVGYLDGPADTELDIVVATGSQTTAAATDSLYAFRATGARRPGWPKHVPASGSGRAPSPALADMDNDGFLDVVMAGTNGRLYVFDRNGNVVAPFANARFSTLTGGATESSPVVADIDGDGRNDVVIGDENGEITAISGRTGAALAGFPIVVDAEVKGTVAVCDCDGDGMTEIVASGWDRNLYVWDYDLPFSPGRSPPWPQFHHDAARTGFVGRPVFVGADGPGPSAAAGRLDLGPARPNPARTSARLWYSIAAADGAVAELAVHDLSGRRVRLLHRGPADAGRFSADWDLRDESGAAVGAGIYFARLTVGAESRARKLIVIR